MALQLVIDSLESVAEPMRGLYQPDGDKFRLDVAGIEDTTGLKSALQKEREAAKTATKQATAWASLGKTPEEIQALLEAQAQAEHDKLTKNGEWDKLKAQMTEQFGTERAQLQTQLKTKDGAIERYLIDAQATAAISELKGSSALLLPHVKASVKVVEDGGEYVTRVVDAAGNPRVNAKGDFLTIHDLVSEMRQSDVFSRAFDSSGASGGGAQGGGQGTGSKTIKQAQFDALPPKERAKLMQSGTTVI